MPIPEPLASLTTDPAFWAAYLPPVDEPAPAHHAQTRVVLPVADGYGLVLEIDLGYGECLLGLRQPAATEPLPLARLDPGRPYAAVLRWAELDLIGRLLALDDPAWPHPGLLVALLHRYAPPAGDPAEADRSAAMLATALRALRRDDPPVTDGRAAADGRATTGDGPAGGPDGADAAAGATPGPVQPPLELFADPSWWPAPATVDPRILDDESVARQVRDHLDHGARTHWRYAAGWGWVAAGQPDGPGAPARVLGAESFPFDEVTELVRRAAARHRRLLDTPWRTPAVAELARQARDTGDLTAVPVLGRALADAGCDHPTVLDALTEPVVPAEAAWVVDALSGIVPAEDDGR